MLFRSKYRVIGLTIETRPDFINRTTIKDYRRWGITRVQIGVQHYNDNILKKINRECYIADTIRAINNAIDKLKAIEGIIKTINANQRKSIQTISSKR